MRDKYIELEIERALYNIKNYVTKLESNDYYSQNSIYFLHTIKKFIEKLEQNIKEIPAGFYYDLLRLINHKFIPILRYIERSQTKNIPWSLVPNIEKLIKELLGDKYLIILRPQWHWNYAILMTDINDFFRRILSDYTLGRINFVEENKYHIISFPVLEKTNFLLHTIFGHEIGHFFQDKYFEENFSENQKDKLLKDIITSLKDEYPELQEASKVGQEIEEIYLAALREIIPDLTGYFLFGPSMIFSLYFFSLWHPDTKLPSKDNDYYPPLKYRIRMLNDLVFKKEGEKFTNKKSTAEQIISDFQKNINEYLSTEDDIQKINSDIKCKKAYELFDSDKKKIINFLNEKLAENSYTINVQVINDLLVRIKNIIPPNEVNNHPVSIADLFLTGWISFYSLLSEIKTEDFKTYTDKYSILSKLLLKASNLIYIHSHFMSKNVNSNKKTN